MGLLRRVQVDDTRTVRWVGEHRPELIDLRPLFEHLAEMEPEQTPSLERWRIALPESATLVRLLGERTAHIRMRGAAVPDLAVKLVLPFSGGAVRKLAEQVRHSRAQRAYLWAHRLRALGIATPRPLGYLERAQRPALEKSFVVTEYVFAPTLIEFRDQRWLERRGRDTVLEKRALIRRVADLLRDLDARGVLRSEPSLEHLLVPEDGALVLVDLDTNLATKARWKGPVPGLARLERAFARPLSMTDRMRFLDAFVRHAADRATQRRALFTEIGKLIREPQGAKA
jgi:hypothetical protein